MASKTFTDRELNYFRICYIVTRIVPEELRKFFKQEWDKFFKASHGEWRDTAKNAVDFCNMESPRNRSRNARLLSVMRNGNTSEWDCTCLFYAILYSDSLGKSLKHSPAWRSIDALREIRNEVFAHTIDGSLEEVDFQASVQKVLTAFSTLKLDPSAIEDMKNQKMFLTDEVLSLQHQLETEKNRIAELCSFCVLPPKPSHDTTERPEEVSSIYEEMTKLRNAKKNETTVTYLSGNPGCGKTEMARQIGQKHFKKDDDEGADLRFVFTLNGFSLDTLLQSYIEFGGQLNCDQELITNINTAKDLSKEEKISHIRGFIATKMQTYSSWLIIVDNIMDLKSVFQYLPQAGEKTVGKGQILVTTQDSQSIPKSDSHTYHTSLSQGLKQEESIALLCQVSGLESDDNALEVVRALDYQPLALACAAVYMKQICSVGKAITWGKYLEKLQNDQLEATEAAYKETSLAYPSTMTTAVNLALEREVDKNEVMMQAFQFLSYVAPYPILLKYVVQYVKKCMPKQDDELLAAKIASSSLVISSDVESKEVRLHQVVHDCMKKVLIQRNTSKYIVFDVVLAFSDIYFFRMDKMLDFLETGKLVPHFESIAAKLQPFIEQENRPSFVRESGLCSNFALIAESLSTIGKICLQHNSFRASNTYFKVTFMIQQERVKDENHPIFAVTQTNMGKSYFYLGQYEDARICLERALSIQSKVYPDDRHPSVVRTLNILSTTMRYLGQLEQAKVYSERAITILESFHDSIDQALLSATLNILGGILQDLSQYEKSKLYLERSLAIEERICGEDHPRVATALNNLALTLQCLGQHEKAKDYLERALSIDKKVFGENHPELAGKLCNLGQCLLKLRQYAEAKDYTERAVTLIEKTLEPTHPLLASSLCYLGTILSVMGQYNEARTYFERSLPIAENAYGDNHPKVATILNYLGLCFKELERYKEAKHYTERAVAIREKTQGPTHSSFADSLGNLGRILMDMGQYNEARTYLERALSIAENVDGDNHRTVANSLDNLGQCFLELEKYEEAKHCAERGVAITEVTLGPTNSMLAISLGNLGNILFAMGKYNEARTYLERALPIAENADGDNHRTVAAVLNNLVQCFLKLEKFEEAKPYAERAVAIEEKTLGPTHSSLANTLGTLGNILYAMGQYNEAIPYFVRSLSIAENVDSDNHPVVATILNNLGLCFLNLRKYEEAKPHAERAVAIEEKTLGPTHSSFADSLCILGNILYGMGQYNEALTYFVRSLSIAENVHGDNHPTVATILNNLGLCLLNLRKYDEAKHFAERAVAIREKTLGPTHPSLADSLFNLGDIFVHMGQYNEAKNYLERALSIAEDVHGNNHPKVAAILNYLGRYN